LHKKKQTLKVTISPTKLKGIAYKLRQQKNAPPTFSMEKEGGANKGVRTTSREGIAITNFTKTNPPILSTREDGWGN
jgi:hypothetical protein